MSGIGPAFDQDVSGATPAARETVGATPRVVADPAAQARTATPGAASATRTPADPPAAAAAPQRARADAAPVEVVPATVEAGALPDAATAPLAQAAAAPVTAATATTLPARPVATVQTPRPAASSPAADAGSLGGLVFSLLLIVGLILALGWLARRMPGFGGAAASKNGLRVVASMPVGARDRVVVVEVGGTQLLLGVGSGGVRTLHTLDAPLPETAAGAPSPFAQVLAQHFGKKA